jgi:hypothetical protein
MQIVLPDNRTEIKLKIPITSEFTAIVSGHGKTISTRRLNGEYRRGVPVYQCSDCGLP